METVIGIIIALAVVGALVYFLVIKKNKTSPTNQVTYNVNIPDVIYTPEAVYKSPGGITFRSYIPVPDEELAKADAGIQHQITNSSHYHPEWTGARNLSYYQIFLVPPDTHNVETDPGSPALMVRYLKTDGTIGVVQSAGTCIGVPGGLLGATDPRYPTIILPYDGGELPLHATYFEESARNESEHIAEWNNDTSLFYYYANTGDVHPHFPDFSLAVEKHSIHKHLTDADLSIHFELTEDQKSAIRDITPED